MEIQVTKEHISKGIRWDDIHCPVALAVNDAVASGAEVASVNTYFVRIGNNYYAPQILIPLPSIAQAFIINFNNSSYSQDAPLEPFIHRAITAGGRCE